MLRQAFGALVVAAIGTACRSGQAAMSASEGAWSLTLAWFRHLGGVG